MAGNAAITLYNGSNSVTYDLWIQSIRTASNNQFSAQQTHAGMNWIPIRRAEMFVDFVALWPLVGTGDYNNSNTLKQGYEDLDPSDGFGKMNRLQDAIKNHHVSTINSAGIPTPMQLTYYNNDSNSPIYNSMISPLNSSNNTLSTLQYSGWIQSAEKQYVKFKNVFYTNYHMNILTKNNSNTPSTVMQPNYTYAPTAATQQAYGDSWISLGPLVASIPKINGIAQ